MDDFVLVHVPVRCGAPQWAQNAFLRGEGDPPEGATRCEAAAWARHEYCAKTVSRQVVEYVLDSF